MFDERSQQYQVPLACMCAKSLQSCLTLCSPMDCSPPGSSVHGDSPGKNIGVDCHAFLQGIFPAEVFALQADSLLSKLPWKPVRCAVLSRSQSLSHIRLFPTPRTVAHQVPLSMGILHKRILEWVAMCLSRSS